MANPPNPNNLLASLLQQKLDNDLFPPPRPSPSGGLLGSLITPPVQPPPLLNLFDAVRPATPPGTGLLGSFFSQPAPPTTPLSTLGLIGSAMAAPAPAVEPPKWIYVTRRFTRFLANLTVTKAQHEDGTTKHAGVRSCLNRHYWGYASDTDNSMLIGSWGKHTRVRPSRDIDLLFVLPSHVYDRFQQRTGNRQSQLLQEMKDVLAVTYHQTAMRGDGQVVSIPFASIPIEVAPAFRAVDGSLLVCDTNNGGSYKTSSAIAELEGINVSDQACNGNTRALVRMLKAWQRERNVSLKSFQLERLAIHFLEGYSYRALDFFWYDFMVRDFFEFLCKYANGQITMPGSLQIVPLGDDWLFQAQLAHRYAIAACDYERKNMEASAGLEWQKIFGTEIPAMVT
jgi:hypothetical protein